MRCISFDPEKHRTPRRTIICRHDWADLRLPCRSSLRGKINTEKNQSQSLILSGWDGENTLEVKKNGLLRFRPLGWFPCYTAMVCHRRVCGTSGSPQILWEYWPAVMQKHLSIFWELWHSNYAVVPLRSAAVKIVRRADRELTELDTPHGLMCSLFASCDVFHCLSQNGNISIYCLRSFYHFS